MCPAGELSSQRLNGPVAVWRDARLLWRSSSKLTVSPAAPEGGRPGPGGLSSSGVEQS